LAVRFVDIDLKHLEKKRPRQMALAIYLMA
jgi:hypothetical protein